MTSAEAMLYQLKNLKGKPLKQKLEHIFTYYWIPILVVAVLAGTYVLILLMPPLLPLLWAFYQILAGKLLSSIFRRYIPEEQASL